MAVKMISPMFLIIMSAMVFYCQTDALQPKDMESRRCYHCSGAGCGVRPPRASLCPPERPYCATVANAPNFTSSLTCAVSGESPCSLTYSTKKTLELICVCIAHLCNAPFSRDLQYELINFTPTGILNNKTDYIDMFWKQSHLVIDNDSHVYQKITMKILESTETPIYNNSQTSKANENSKLQEQAQGRGGQFGTASGPRADMLKQETTAPSDDDEDDGEGSGSEEEGQPPRRTSPPAPAAPSSYLPADDNSAHRPFLALIATVPAFFYLMQ